MRIILLIVGCVLLSCTNSFGQRKLPKNLKQTVYFLDKELSDSVKNVIITFEDEYFKDIISFEDQNQYKIINDWLDNEKSGIYKYLTSKRIHKLKREIILENYKNHLLNKSVDEKILLEPYLQIEKRWRFEDEHRATIDTLRGIYIPKDLEDCFEQINSFWDDETKTKIKNMAENEFSGNAHFGFGMWMRNNWQLWGGSRLSKYFNNLGIHHPDDMSGIILCSYHRHLTGKDINIEKQIKDYQDYWEEAKIRELEKKQEEFSEYKIGETVDFLYTNGFASTEQENKYDDDICIVKGMITDKNTENFLIKVKLIESCDKKGIVYYDNKGSIVYNTQTKNGVSQKKKNC